MPTLGGSLAAVHAELAQAARRVGRARAPRRAARHRDPARTTSCRRRAASLGHDDVAVGRLRAAGARLAFVLALNDLRLGAALGVVAAAEALFR